MSDAGNQFLCAEHDFISVAQPAVDIRFKPLPVQERPVQALQVANIILSVSVAEDHTMSSSDARISSDPAVDIDSPPQKELRIFYQEIIDLVRRIQDKGIGTRLLPVSSLHSTVK